MNLHRSGRKSDWAKRPRKRWNEWQKLAAFTGGTVTIGNVFTAIGLVGVMAGLYLVTRHMYVAALLLIAAGRFCDLLDGWLADATGTKSPLGEKLDASVDKIETALTIIVLVLASVVPLWAAIAISVPQLAIALLAYAAIRRGKSFHPSRTGKLGMALVWLSLAGFVLMRVLSGSHQWLDFTVYSLAVAAALAGCYALPEYYRPRKV
jgi:cardiolipin synthase (CMP-forming)